MTQYAMAHEADPKKELLKQVGNLNGIEIFNNQVLVAVYVRPEKTAGGIVLPDKHRDEDRNQGKIGLLIKKGPLAFVEEQKQWFAGAEIGLHDWILFRPSDGWAVTINGVRCRVLDDTYVRGKVAQPDQIW